MIFFGDLNSLSSACIICWKKLMRQQRQFLMESLGFHLPPTHPCLQTQLPVQHYESTKVFLACLMGKGRDSINYRLKTLKKKANLSSLPSVYICQLQCSNSLILYITCIFIFSLKPSIFQHFIMDIWTFPGSELSPIS